MACRRDDRDLYPGLRGARLPQAGLVPPGLRYGRQRADDLEHPAWPSVSHLGLRLHGVRLRRWPGAVAAPLGAALRHLSLAIYPARAPNAGTWPGGLAALLDRPRYFAGGVAGLGPGSDLPAAPDDPAH